MLKIINFILLSLLFSFNESFSQKDTILVNNKTGEKCYGKVLTGKKIGIWKCYTQDSTLSAIENYYSDSLCQRIVFESALNENWSTNTYNRYIKYIYTYVINSNGEKKLSGDFFSYNKNQGISTLNHYERNKLHGTCFGFHDVTGNVMYKKNYHNGKLDGCWYKYYRNQNVEIRGEYKNNNKHGSWEWFYPNGQLQEKGEYLSQYYLIKYKDFIDFELIVLDSTLTDTIPENKYTNQMKVTIKYLYDSNESFPYKMYLKDGIWQYWDIEGRLEKIEIYKEGSLVKSFIN